MSYVEPPDWEAEGDCERCGQPLGDKPGKVTYGAKGQFATKCYRHAEHRCGARHGNGVARCDLRERDCRRLSTEEKQARLGVTPRKIPMTAYEVFKGIRGLHASPQMGNPEWLVFEEFQLGSRRVDALALSVWTSKGFRMVAYEIKVDRRDFDLEIKNPQKRAPAMEHCSQFWFATPVGLVTPEEVPDGCGLMEFGQGPRGNKFHWQAVVQAPTQLLPTVSPQVVYGIAWRLRDLQARMRARGIAL